jgi:hypothetical protein
MSSMLYFGVNEMRSFTEALIVSAVLALPMALYFGFVM